MLVAAAAAAVMAVVVAVAAVASAAAPDAAAGVGLGVAAGLEGHAQGVKGLRGAGGRSDSTDAFVPCGRWGRGGAAVGWRLGRRGRGRGWPLSQCCPPVCTAGA